MKVGSVFIRLYHKWFLKWIRFFIFRIFKNILAIRNAYTLLQLRLSSIKLFSSYLLQRIVLPAMSRSENMLETDSHPFTHDVLVFVIENHQPAFNQCTVIFPKIIWEFKYKSHTQYLMSMGMKLSKTIFFIPSLL